MTFLEDWQEQSGNELLSQVVFCLYINLYDNFLSFVAVWHTETSTAFQMISYIWRIVLLNMDFML